VALCYRAKPLITTSLLLAGSRNHNSVRSLANLVDFSFFVNDFFAFNKIRKDLRVIANSSLEFPDYCIHGPCKRLNIYQILFLVSEHGCPGATCGSGGVHIEFVYLVYFVHFVYLVGLVYLVCFVLCQLYKSALWSFLTVVYVTVAAPFPRPYGGGFLQLRIPKGSARELRSERTVVFTQNSGNSRSFLLDIQFASPYNPDHPDRVAGGGFWLLSGEARIRGRRRIDGRGSA